MEDAMLVQALQSIPPSSLSYSDWLSVGMAIHEKGWGCEVWDDWSKPDERYKPGDCERRWRTFGGSASRVNPGTIIKMAEDYGFSFQKSKSNDWEPMDDPWGCNPVYPADFVLGKPIAYLYPTFDPVKEIKTHLSSLFQPDDCISFVADSWQKDDGKYVPGGRGCFSKTCRQVLDELEKYKDDPECIDWIIGKTDPEAGAWLRINPVDGQGVGNANVTDFRFGLVECDSLPLDEQIKTYKELKLPIQIMVSSGRRSVHAVIRVDAKDQAEYSQRMRRTFELLKGYGLEVDENNKNPSRLSRFAGFQRGDSYQRIIELSSGFDTWQEWESHMDTLIDDLPEVEAIEDFADTDIQLAPELIEGVLRQGHKMLIAGPSKAGKSFALIELALAIGNGGYWMGKKCAKGRVLYLNLELDRNSCIQRVKEIAKALNLPVSGVDLWNLRGQALPMDKLADKLIARLKKKSYTAVIIDPIYKVITGDENNASEMGRFCNYFDRICTQAEVSAIYCHHFSKGAQGGKVSMDRASGSGVFARDPDAILSLSPLEMSADDEQIASYSYKRQLIEQRFKADFPEHYKTLTDTVRKDATFLLQELGKVMDTEDFAHFNSWLDSELERTKRRTGWRLEFTLREFETPEPLDIYFQYPVHTLDADGRMKKIKVATGETGMKKVHEGRKKQADDDREKRASALDTAIANLSGAVDKITVKDLANYFDKSEKSIRRWIEESGKWQVVNNLIAENPEAETEEAE